MALAHRSLPALEHLWPRIRLCTRRSASPAWARWAMGEPTWEGFLQVLVLGPCMLRPRSRGCKEYLEVRKHVMYCTGIQLVLLVLLWLGLPWLAPPCLLLGAMMPGLLGVGVILG